MAEKTGPTPPTNPEDIAKNAANESRESDILTVQEIEAVRAEARAQIMADRKKSAKKQFLEMEKERLRREEGLTTGSAVKDEIVNITIDLAEHSSCICINMQSYWHGQTYQVPRHVAETLREIMQRGWRHQDEIDGKNLTQHYQRPRADVISGKTGGVVTRPGHA